jgi:hypothetical protein
METSVKRSLYIGSDSVPLPFRALPSVSQLRSPLERPQEARSTAIRQGSADRPLTVRCSKPKFRCWRARNLNKAEHEI